VSIPVRVVDAFAEAPFAGNPAAVCRLEEWLPDGILTAVAREMNLSETAFVVPAAAPAGDPAGAAFELRWFTPAVEVPLCGHATLASAHVLWEDGLAPADRPIRFLTRRSGELLAERAADGSIVLDLPLDPVEPIDPPPGLEEALGRRPVAVGRAAGANLLVELPTAADVRSLAPDMAWTAALEDGLIVTAASDDPRFAVVSRYFDPRAGIPEDPVTGSAHCALAAWWAPRVGHHFRAWQASARGGALAVELAGDRVRVGGRAVTVLRGELLLDAPAVAPGA
jgi:predicted PhzF superfamily epimerase YddE/YHI9